MKKVTKEEFYKVIYDGQLDVVTSLPRARSRCYDVEFRFRNGQLFGMSKDNGNAPDDYYIARGDCSHRWVVDDDGQEQRYCANCGIPEPDEVR